MRQGMACAVPTHWNKKGRTGKPAGYEAHRRAGEPACEACVTARRERQRRNRKQAAARSKRVARRPAPGMACATRTRRFPDGRTGKPAGRAAHRAANEPLCSECLESETGWQEQQRKAASSGPPPGMACAAQSGWYKDGATGKAAGYRRHQRAGEVACDACRAAYRDEQRMYRQTSSRRPRRSAGDVLVCAKPTDRYPDGRTGTPAGCNAHNWVGEPPCEACNTAGNWYARVRRWRLRLGCSVEEAEAAIAAADLANASATMACQKVSPTHPHGKTGNLVGYQAHHQAGEPVCDDCRAAHRAHHRQMGEQQRGTARSSQAAARSIEQMLEQCATEFVDAWPHTPAQGWREHRACVGCHPKLFFAPHERPAERVLRLCVSCPVRLDCAADGLTQPFGMWGGLPLRERRKVANKVRAPGRHDDLFQGRFAVAA